jgi:hypothetical protein
MKLASRSAIASENSANIGSNDSSGVSDGPPTLRFPDSRSDERDDGRNGVVGLDVGLRPRELERFAALSPGVADEDIAGGRNV